MATPAVELDFINTNVPGGPSPPRKYYLIMLLLTYSAVLIHFICLIDQPGASSSTSRSLISLNYVLHHGELDIYVVISASITWCERAILEGMSVISLYYLYICTDVCMSSVSWRAGYIYG